MRVRHEGTHFRSGPLSCTMLLDSSLAHPHVGYALGRHVGVAVRRNRLRRQLRVLLKTHENLLQPGFYVFGASPQATKATAQQLAAAVENIAQSCHAKASQS